VTGVAARLEPCEDAKLAGWKRGRDGSLSWPGSFDDRRALRAGRLRAWDGMSRGPDLGESGEVTDGMVRSADNRGCVGLELETSREREEGEADLI
jgi:hypothetical protein